MNFPFVLHEKLMPLDVPIFKHIRVSEQYRINKTKRNKTKIKYNIVHIFVFIHLKPYQIMPQDSFTMFLWL